MTTLGSLWRAVTLTVENSRALAAARGAYQRGAGIPEIVRAWSAETANGTDDALPRQLEAALRSGAEYLEQGAVWAVAAATRIEALAPEMTDRLDEVARWCERTGPAVVGVVRRTSDTTRRLAPQAQRMASGVSVAAGRLAERLRVLKGEP